MRRYTGVVSELVWDNLLLWMLTYVEQFSLSVSECLSSEFSHRYCVNVWFMHGL